MNPIGKAELVAYNVEQQLVGKAAPQGVLRTSVYYFLKNEMPVRIVFQIGVGDYSLEVAPMPVEVACYNKAAVGRQADQIIAQRGWLLCPY
jgi:hypothetical protein